MPAAGFLPRRPGKRLGAALAAVVVFALAGPWMPAAATSAGTVTVSAVPADSGDLAGGTDLRLSVSLTNDTLAATENATVTVSVAGAPVTTRTVLADWFSGEGKSNLAAHAVGTGSFPPVAAGLASSIQVTVPASALPFVGAGVYPVSVRVATGTTVLGESRPAVASSVSASDAVPVAVAVPLTVPAGESTFLTAAELTTYTGPGGILTRELTDIQNSKVAVGIDPRILASIRVLGNAAPASARAWLLQLQAIPNETFPLAWADADITAPLHAGQPSVLETKSLDYAIDASQFPLTQPQSGATPTPTPTGSTTLPVVPTSATLVAWNYSMPQLAWPAENSVVSSDLSKLNQAGITAAILASTNVSDADGRASAKVGSTTLAISDSVLSGYLRTAIQSPVRTASSQALTELVTTLALVSLASSGTPRPLLLTLDRNWAFSDTNFARGVGQVAAHSWSSLAGLASVLATAPATVAIAKKTESRSRIALVASMLAAEQEVVSFAPIAKTPDVLTSSTRLKLLSLLSNEWTTPSWRTAADAFLTQSSNIVNSVEVDPSREILAIADQTSLPVTVSNTLDQNVTVTLVVASLSTRVTLDPKTSSQQVTVDEGTQKRILIPMSALSNGKAAIVVTLKSSTGVPIGLARTININVQAGWETAGTLAFAALIVGLFGFGIFRTIRSRRRMAVETDETDEADEA